MARGDCRRSIPGRGNSYAGIGRKLDTFATSPDVHAVNLRNVVHYVLKATDARVAHDLGLSHDPEYGRVIGKQASWSENIGAAARTTWACR